MKAINNFLWITISSALLLGTPAIARELLCKSVDEAFTIDITADKIAVSGGYGELARETKDPDCIYRASRYACYEEGQVMINIPMALAEGSDTHGTVYVQLDTSDNADSRNHALLGTPYTCDDKYQ